MRPARDRRNAALLPAYSFLLGLIALLGFMALAAGVQQNPMYASGFQQFLRVTLPLSLPGVVAAFFMVFIPTVGEYVTPLLVGGTGGSMYGNLIQDFFTRAASWATGAALSVLMLVVTLVLVAVAIRLVDLRRLAS